MAQPAVVFNDLDLRIPRGVDDLHCFRAWSLGNEFPESGRVDFLDGLVEVDMSPEELQSHAFVKTEIAGALRDWIVREDRGVVAVDSTRIVNPAAGLSVEPDVVGVLWDCLESGRAKLVESPSPPGSLLEIEGSPDLVVEIVSRSSVQKDTQRLPPLYAASGVRELWIIDARSLDEDDVRLDLLTLDSGMYLPVEADGEGFKTSKVLGRSVQLTRSRSRVGTWRYQLEGR
jgi:Uma2 family endonuclease